MSETSADEPRPKTKNLEGLGGWLVLVGIGIVVSPFTMLFSLLPTYVPIFTDGTWEALTTEGSAAYAPYWAPLLLTEILVNAVVFLGSCSLIYLFFARKALFPAVYIAVAGLSLVFILADTYAGTLVFPDEPAFDKDTIRDLSSAVMGVVIWVPYMLVSKRVQATFTR